MFIRGRQPEAVIWPHFRRPGDSFAFGVRDGLCEARVHTNATRAVELLLALTEHMPPAVDVWLDDWRHDRLWHGDGLATSDVRDAVARIKGVLTTFGGVDFTFVAEGGAEQVTLTANLGIYVFSRTDRWLYLLQGKGLQRDARLRVRSWTLRRGEFAPSAELDAAVAATVERLHLVPAPRVAGDDAQP
jgi:hypothetical protein